MMFSQIIWLIKREAQVEWRNKHMLNGMLLYVAVTVFVCYQSFKRTDPITWNALFWIIMLFAAINAVAKSFMGESKGRMLYYYTLISPSAMIIAKIIYNFVLLNFISFTALFLYSIVLGNPVQDTGLFLISVLFGSLSFSAVLTMISAISAKASNNSTLMAVISLPVLIPVLIALIKLSKNAMDGLPREVSYDEIGLLASINVIVLAASLVLFPYLWKE